MKVGVITRNKGKIKIVDFVFPKYGIEYEFIGKEFPEIQAATSGETRTFAEYPYEERIPVWAGYYEKMAKYISSLK